MLSSAIAQAQAPQTSHQGTVQVSSEHRAKDTSLKEQTKALLKLYDGSDGAKLDRDLAKLGWQSAPLIPVSNGSSIQSSSSCGSTTPDKAYHQGNGIYLVVG